MRTISSTSATLAEVDYLTRIQAGRHSLLADEPASAGGTDAGPAPYDYLLAGLAACTLMTLRMYAQKKGWELGTMDVQITLGKDQDKQTHIHRQLSSSVSLTEEQWQKLLEIAAKTPVTLTLLQGAAITTERAGDSL
ncbi:MAG: osmotically inducible protein C [Gammaproteobacteria bacterium HGW-Gammaproteobacteria-14]|nr:MAG: osmotically inducible protein C [Gammaproteobacteria bacterium HGW-Gammaproteobacteria-14]